MMKVYYIWYNYIVGIFKRFPPTPLKNNKISWKKGFNRKEMIKELQISVKYFCGDWKYIDISLSSGLRSKGHKFQVAKMEFVNVEFGAAKWDSKSESDKR